MYIKEHDPRFFNGAWCHRRELSTKLTVDLVNTSPYNFKGKSLICLGGGLGRTANALLKLGFSEVANLEINPLNVMLGKKYYPDVKHIQGDYNIPIDTYDFFLFEDIFDLTYNEYIFCNIMKWNEICPHIVTEQEMNIYEFDSKRLDQTFKQTEKEGNEFIENHFFNGNVLYTDLASVENLKITKYKMPLTNFDFDIHPSNTHSYTAFGMTYDWLEGEEMSFKATLINKGRHRKYDSATKKFVDKNPNRK